MHLGHIQNTSDGKNFKNFGGKVIIEKVSE
jgi:hypothetical protein